jgi:alpha-mannosidase
MEKERAMAFAGIKGEPIEALHLAENGEVRTTVEALMEYGDSKACVRYSVDKLSGLLEVNVIVFFAEKEKRLKLSIPAALPGAEHIGQTVFGRERLDVCKGDHVSQYWSCIANQKDALYILNDGVYGSDFSNGTARLTLLRSAGYGASAFLMGEPFHEPYFQPRMEQGERHYRFVLGAGPAAEALLKVDREAAVLNMPAFAVAYCPAGTGKKPASLVEIDKENVSLSCFKRSEGSASSYIVRVFEAQGIETGFTLKVPCLGLSKKDKLRAFEIKTYKVDKKGIEPVDMLETK